MTRPTARSTRRRRAASGRLPPLAVVRVRASVQRLESLAGRGATALQVTAELHELERAVASMLGNAGLPAAAVQQQGAGSPVERTVEWTTTGVVR